MSRSRPSTPLGEVAAIAEASAPGPAAQELLAPAFRALVAEARAAAKRVAALAPRSEEADPEAIHDLRVAIRRLRTVLRPVRPLYGRRKIRVIADDLKRVADATGSLRDEEVLRETLGALDLPADVRPALAAWMASRRKREQASRASVVRLLKPPPAHRRMAHVVKEKKQALREPLPAGVELLSHCLHRLERRLDRTKARDVGFSELERAAIASARTSVIEAAAADPGDALAMHTLRIRWKRLRYTAELFAEQEAEGSAQRESLDRLAKRAARMQKRLGEVHDFDEAIVRLRRAWGLPVATREAVIASLTTARKTAANRASAEVAAEVAAWRSEASP